MVDYTLDDDDYPETDPGSELRKELETTIYEINNDVLSRLSELLYTASERDINGFEDFNLGREQVITVLKLFKIDAL